MSRSAKTIWLPVARSLAADIAVSGKRPQYIAISGAQGSGKTTLAHVLTEQLDRLDVSAVARSLDDFYLPRSRRVGLSQTVHPLLRTRGVPGTHDVELCLRVLDEVTRRPTRLPTFDKGVDDRVAPAHWPIAGPVDAVVIEGWCLGARAQTPAELAEPVNELEREEDADGGWRGFVNAALGRYQPLFDRFDRLIYLQIPDFDCVRVWRGEQESRLPHMRRMNDAQLVRFIAHYERLTRWMAQDVPGRADAVVVLGRDHGIERFVTKSASPAAGGGP